MFYRQQTDTGLARQELLFSAQAYSVKDGSWAGQSLTSSCQGSPGAELPLEQGPGGRGRRA